MTPTEAYEAGNPYHHGSLQFRVWNEGYTKCLNEAKTRQTEQPSHISGQGEGKDKHWALAYSEREKELRECLGELITWYDHSFEESNLTMKGIITKAKSLINPDKTDL